MSDRRRRFITVLAVALFATNTFAQRGDRDGEVQPPLPDDLEIPPAPVLSPEEGLASLTVKDGFRVELVAAEPLVEDPVQIVFDAAGHMYVIEMRAYMPNVDGTGELAPICRIVRLDDHDGDGIMDGTTVFLDELVLPRAIAPFRDGLLVVEPPELRFHRDTDGDGRADEARVLYTGFKGRDNPEHAGNGLLFGIDGWIHCSQHPLRFRADGESLQSQPTPGHGQWGIAVDDVGRLFYTTNSDPLRGDRVPLHYASRNAGQRQLVGVNERLAKDMRVWPVRVTPGVNRGYQEGLLDEGYLTRFTSACGPTIYRGDLFPSEFHGNAFVCEPAAFIIKRYTLREEDERLVADPAYADSEFLASTDERFRPVNMITGPDGALYIVDLYRGVIQHKTYVTSFLRQQIIERALETPLGLGRIYRVVPDDVEIPRAESLVDADTPTLVEAVASPNGWRRDTARRLLSERQPSDAAPLLRWLFAETTDAVTRLHALWSIDLVGAITIDDIYAAAQDPDRHVRAAAVRLVERWIDAPAGREIVEMLIDDPSRSVRVQVALSLGEGWTDESVALMHRMATEESNEREIRSALVSGIDGRETAFLRRLAGDDAWSDGENGRGTLVQVVTDGIFGVADGGVVSELLSLIADESTPRWMRERITARTSAAMRLDQEHPRTLMIASEPTGWAALLDGGDDEPLATQAQAIDGHLDWPGRAGGAPMGPRTLTRDEELRFLQGRRLFRTACASCHLENGKGQLGIAPPLVGTPGVHGSEQRLIRIMLHGMTGEIEIEGNVYDAEMPRADVRGDDKRAALLTYIRRAWGNTAPPVEPETVKEVRLAEQGRRTPWKVEELEDFE